MLESNGIVAIVSSDDAGGLEPQWQLTQGVRVLVAPEDVERELGARDVRDHEVEEPLSRLEARGLADDRRWREVGELREQRGADRLLR